MNILIPHLASHWILNINLLHLRWENEDIHFFCQDMNLNPYTSLQNWFEFIREHSGGELPKWKFLKISNYHGIEKNDLRPLLKATSQFPYHYRTTRIFFDHCRFKFKFIDELNSDFLCKIFFWQCDYQKGNAIARYDLMHGLEWGDDIDKWKTI